MIAQFNVVKSMKKIRTDFRFIFLIKIKLIVISVKIIVIIIEVVRM